MRRTAASERFDRRDAKTHDACMDPKTYFAKIEMWGGGLAIRLPSAIAESFDLKECEDVEIMAIGGGLSRQSCDSDRMNALERLRVFRGRMSADFAFDRSEANER